MGSLEMNMNLLESKITQLQSMVEVLMKHSPDAKKEIQEDIEKRNAMLDSLAEIEWRERMKSYVVSYAMEFGRKLEIKGLDLDPELDAAIDNHILRNFKR
jgi:hypothetical protein